MIHATAVPADIQLLANQICLFGLRAAAVKRQPAMLSMLRQPRRHQPLLAAVSWSVTGSDVGQPAISTECFGICISSQAHYRPQDAVYLKPCGFFAISALVLNLYVILPSTALVVGPSAVYLGVIRPFARETVSP
jgi:hypothetical protein